MHSGQTNTLSLPIQERSHLRPHMSWLWTSIFILLGALLIIVLNSICDNSVVFRPLLLHSPTDCILLLAAACLALIFHETGHLIMAVYCGFQIRSVSLGPVRFSRAAHAWHMQPRTKGLFTASVAAIPRTNEFWRERMIAVVSAGPVSTVSTALLAMCLSHSLPAPHHLVSFFLSAFIQISFVIFVLGFIPNSSAAQTRNDAALFLALCRDGKEADEIFLYHLVLQHQATSQTREYPLWLIKRMAGYQGRSDFMTLYAKIIGTFNPGEPDQSHLGSASSPI